MKWNKNFTFGIGFGQVGARARHVSGVWGLGPHLFMNGGDLIFRICYYRDEKTTYYWQISKTVKKKGEVTGNGV